MGYTIGCFIGLLVALIVRPPKGFFKFTIVMIGVGSYLCPFSYGSVLAPNAYLNGNFTWHAKSLLASCRLNAANKLYGMQVETDFVHFCIGREHRKYSTCSRWSCVSR
eukprot:c26254_g2_i7 orf=1405-1728(+)